MLWQKLEDTRKLFENQCKVFCIRRVLQNWIPCGVPTLSTLVVSKRVALYRISLDDAIWLICTACEQHGYDLLPSPDLYPYRNREFLHAFVSVYLGTGMRGVDCSALDEAYSVVFPMSTPINFSKKGALTFRDYNFSA